MIRRHLVRVGYDFLRPAFAWRGRILSRKYSERTRFYDARARAGIEKVIDVFEMWVHKPDFDRMQKQIDDMKRMGEELQALAAKHGIDLNAPESRGGG